MNDYKEIWQSFIKSISSHKNLKDLVKLLDSGKATYEEAQKYSSSLANYLVGFLSAENPTNAEQVLEVLKNKSICKNFFKEVDDYTYSMQKALNEANDIGLNAVKVASPRELIDSTASLSNDYEKDIANLANKVELNANKHVDTVQQANARFQSDANYSITVSRTYDGKGLSDGRACEWCLSRVGHNIPYDEAYKRGMFQRHEGCHCIIEYNNNGAKTYQTSKGGRNSWKQAQETNRGVEKQRNINYEERKKYQLDMQYFGGKTNHAKQRTSERKIDDRSIEYAKKNALKVSDIYYNSDGKPTQDYIGEKITAIVNPETGVTVTVFRTSAHRIKIIKQKLKDKK